MRKCYSHLKTTAIYFPQFCRLESPRSRFPQILFLVRTLFLACEQLPSSKADRQSSGVYPLLEGDQGFLWHQWERTCLPVQETQRHLGSIPAREDPLEEGVATHSSILAQRIPMDRGAWWATVHGVTKSRTELKQLSTARIRASGLLDYGPTCMPSFNYHLSIGPVSNYSHTGK